ncbi:MAG: CDP-glycerol glycerophosphotransferase family protein [Candidatus Limnocylindrus sp.]
MNQLELTLTRLVLGLVAFVAHRFGLKNQVLFASSRDHALGPQLAALSTAIREAAPELEQRVALAPYGYGITSKLRYLIHLIGATWALHRVKITIIDNAWLPVHITARRRGSRVVQVWHAEGAYKRFGHAARGASTLADGALRAIIHRGYDAALVSSEEVRAAYSEAFQLPVERVYAVGPLHGAWLASEALVAARANAIREQYPSLKGRRVLLYAPTFRGRGVSRRSALAISPDAIAAALPPDWIVLIKAHPLVPITDTATHPSCLIVDRRTPVEDLFPVADALFTDYSSSVFLWSLMARPLLLAIDDLEEYSQDPGLFVNLSASGGIGQRVSSAADIVTLLTAREAHGDAVTQERYHAFAERYLGPRTELDGAPARAAELILSDELPAQRKSGRQ